MKMFKGISNKLLILLIFSTVFLKIFFYFLIKFDYIYLGLGGGDDSEYYHAYALGYSDEAVNIWPIILKFINDIGLYSRDGISYLFLFFNLFFIPILISKLSNLSLKNNQKYYLYSLFICLVYPTIFIYTFDIYRDVFMVFCFLVGCLFVKKSLISSNFFHFAFLYLISILIGIFLLALRPYLGYSFLLALIILKVRLNKNRIYFFAFLYFITLFFLNYIGLFERLTEYRSGFNEVVAGSTLGLDFSNPLMFIPNFVLSILGQLFGLYFINPLSIIIFFVETVPFIFMLFYIFKNIKYADGFIKFLIAFFVLYASIWLIGNDNLGTALRLRMFNYFAVYICFFYIIFLKNQSRYH